MDIEVVHWCLFFIVKMIEKMIIKIEYFLLYEKNNS